MLHILFPSAKGKRKKSVFKMFVFDFLRLASVEVFEGDALKTTTLLETI